MIKLQFIHCVKCKHDKKGTLLTITLPICQRDAEYYHLFMIFAVFDARLLTQWINCSFYHLYLLFYYHLRTFYST